MISGVIILMFQLMCKGKRCRTGQVTAFITLSFSMWCLWKRMLFLVALFKRQVYVSSCACVCVCVRVRARSCACALMFTHACLAYQLSCHCQPFSYLSVKMSTSDRRLFPNIIGSSGRKNCLILNRSWEKKTPECLKSI